MTFSKKKLKILCILQYPVVPFQGGTPRCARQVKFLAGQGMEVILLCLKIKEAQYQAELAAHDFSGARIVPSLPNGGTPLLRELAGLLFSWPVIWKMILQERPDIVHVHNPPDTIAFVSSIICKIKGTPLIYDVHDPGPEIIRALIEWPRLKRWVFEKAARIQERVILQYASGIITVSQTLLNLLVNTRPVISKRNIPAMVILNSFSPSDEGWSVAHPQAPEGAPTQPYALYLGHLFPAFMGLEAFLEVFTQVAPEGMEVHIAGDGPYRKTLEEFVRHRGIVSRVRFLGYHPPEELPAIIQQAFVCVTPLTPNLHTRLALPKKVFEYMAFGKAILFPDLPGMDEILGTDNPGRYRADDLDDMKVVLKRLLFDDKVRQETEKKNGERFEATSYESEMKKLIGLYQQVLQ